jgi:hypothetical protein
MSAPKRIAAALALALVSFAGTSRADDADRTFQEGLSLYDAGKIAEACVKFGESYALDAALGTLQNLAACHEREGKRALALREWLDLAEGAQKNGKSAQESLARQHVVALSTTLPRLVVRVDPKSGVDRVELDDAPLEPGKEHVVDPGRHRLVFAGSGRISTTRTIEPTEGRAFEIDAPMLESDRGAPPPPPARNERSVKREGMNVGWIFFGSAGVLVAAGAASGIAAIGARSASDDHCQPGCDARGVELNDRAKALAWTSNIGIGLGAALVAVGIYWLVARKPAF